MQDNNATHLSCKEKMKQFPIKLDLWCVKTVKKNCFPTLRHIIDKLNPFFLMKN